LPIRVALRESNGPIPLRLESSDHLISEDAVGAPAVGHDFRVRGQLAKPSVEFVVRDVPSTLNVARLVFGAGPHVEDYDIFEATPEFHGVYRFEFTPVAEILGYDGIDFIQSSLPQFSDGLPGVKDTGVGKGVMGIEPFAANAHQHRGLQDLQVLRDVRHRGPDVLGQLLNGSLALGENLDELEPVRVTQGFADSGEFAEETGLERSFLGCFHGYSIILLNSRIFV
jgi:hypothetical protein